MVTAWLLMCAAIAVEVASTTALKAAASSDSHLGWTVTALAGVIVSYLLMDGALRLQMEASVAYAVWSGVGTTAIAIIGALGFGESLHPAKMIGIALIIVGVALLNLAPGTQPAALRHPHSSTYRLVEALSGLDTALDELARLDPARVRRVA
ncbi:DMT family transporter [Nonomuraea sp. NPDC050536]|uniref:DMT family transporter n=1 Tax=Nonomuraea sp. NPDC050536 TaxID=3364366 RepID=UPI0037C7B665